MTSENLNQPEPAISAVPTAFVESLRHVLEQIVAAPFTATPAPPDPALADSGEWVRFRAAQRITGEFAFAVSRPDALRLAQILMAGPLEESVEFAGEHRDALTELCRQFAGDAATRLKAQCGGEVDLQFVDAVRPEWAPATPAGCILQGEKTPPTTIYVAISADLAAALAGALQPAAAIPAPLSSSPLPEPPAAAQPLAEPPAPPVDKNIELLLDVELEVALRFGQRQLMLKEILELQNGAVVELEQQIQEPVELLVGGKVIAHGEVVIVDGNYGLRVTQILNPQQRLAALAR